MSLTLRDAQHLSWKTYKKFETLNEKRPASVGTVDALVKKAGEIFEKIKTEESSKEGKEAEGKLLSELLFTALVLAESRGVELEDSFLQTVDELILGFVS